MTKVIHTLGLAVMVWASSPSLGAQEGRSVPVDADGFPKVEIAQVAKGHITVTSGEARADLFVTGERFQYKVTKPGSWMLQAAEIEELNLEQAKVTRMGDSWSVHILCRQPDRRIFTCVSFSREGWDRSQIVGGVSMGGPSDSIDIRLPRRKAEELLALLHAQFM